MPLPTDGATCGQCLRAPPAWSRAVAAVDYAFPWDRLIVDFKFHGRLELARPLAERLRQAVQDAGAEREVDLLLPVPLAPARLAERGFNQAWELARRLGAALRLPAQADALQRPLAGAHQADLPRAERALNLRGAFLVEPRWRSLLRGRRIALVDDVLTTGATAREAATALLRAGTGAVQVWTVARTP